MMIDPDDKLQIFVRRETRWSREFWRLTLRAKAPRESGGAPLVALVQAALRDGNRDDNRESGRRPLLEIPAAPNATTEHRFAMTRWRRGADSNPRYRETHIRSEFSGGLAYYSPRTKASVLERNLFARNSAVFRLSPVRCCTSE